MEKVEILFIRACKSLNATTRVKSVYRRFYLTDKIPEQQLYTILTFLLANIVERYLMSGIRLNELIDHLNPKNSIYGFEKEFETQEKNNYLENALNQMISYLRFSSIDKYPEYPVPSKFRNKESVCIKNSTQT
jgi:hypothetical protein